VASNLRAKPIEGHVTDSAGNVLRNAKIVIKQATPYGSFVVDTINTDDSGYLISKPIQNGVYDIYEGGILITRTIHEPDRNSIQCFKAHSDNYNTSIIKNFNNLVDSRELNNFKAFVQIEPAEIDVLQYGSSFPIYDFDLTSETSLDATTDELWNLSQFLGLNSTSRITTTRFDVEYYAPMTAVFKNYRRIRWSGVPAIRYSAESKLVLPLDYFSITLSMPRVVGPLVGEFGVKNVAENWVSFTGSDDLVNLSDNEYYDEFVNAMDLAKVGDIIKIFVSLSGVSAGMWYGIILDIDKSDVYSVTLERLRSSRFASTVDPEGSANYYASRIMIYDGMFQGISDISEEANERFSVVENVYSQDSGSGELYNYNNRII